MRRMIVATAAVLCFLVPEPASAQVALQWKFKAGDQFYQETITELKQTIQFMDQEFKQRADQRTVSRFTVLKKLDDGSVEIEQVIEELQVKNIFGAPPLGNLLQDLQGARFVFTLTPKGDISKFEGYEDLVQRIAKGDKATEEAVRAVLQEETLKQNVAEAIAFLKSEPVQPGDKWSSEKKIPLGPVGSVEAKQTYTYEGPGQLDGRDLERISVSSEMHYIPPKESNEKLPFKITAGDLKAEGGKGTIWFDAAAGRLVRSEYELHLTGSLKVLPQGGNANQALTLQIDQDQKVTIRITDKKPSSK